MDIHYRGENQCQARLAKGGECQNKSYFNTNGVLKCGVHSKKDVGRLELLVNPNSEERLKIFNERRRQTILSLQDTNRILGRPGKVITTKLRMMKAPERLDSYISVFPNFRSGQQTDGVLEFRMPNLSPMKIPVGHEQPGLPPSKNLENFHQGNKVFASEVDSMGSPLPIWYERRLAMYNDEIPHRHKLGKTKAEHMKAAKCVDNANICLYSIIVLPNGKTERISYVDSRKYYCRFYEEGVKNTSEYKQLQQYLEDGYNLQIFGYDAYPIDEKENITKHYNDPGLPFGHEMVLYTMLTLTPSQYPWKQ